MIPSNAEVALIRGEPLEVHGSIYYHLERGLNRNPNGAAVRPKNVELKCVAVVMHQPKDHLSQLSGPASTLEPGTKSLVWTHTQLRRAALKVARGLIASGVERGSRLATLISNRVEWPLLQYASTLCEASFVPLDFGALNQPREVELKNFMTRLKPDAIFVGTENDARSIDWTLAKANHPAPKVRVVLDGQDSNSNGWISLLDLASKVLEVNASEDEILDRARAADPGRISLIAFTSGTSSGTPKGCPRHAGGDAFTIEAQKETFNFDEKSRYLLASANFRIIAPALSIATWTRGGAIVMPGPGFDPKTVMQAMQDHRITHILLVPFQLHALVKDESFSPEKTKPVRYAKFGGDIVTKELLQKAQRCFPTAKVGAGYGMTEGGAVFSWPYNEGGVDEIPDYGDISTLGTVAPGSSLRIYDHENNRIAKRNETGEFQICSPVTIKNYLENVDQEAWVQEGPERWFKTGDVGFINEKGEVFLLGRLNDRVKRAGIRIEPAALQASISQFVGTQVAVLGVPHPELGQEPYAVVEDFNDKTEDQVKQHVIDVFDKVSALAGACSLEQLGMSQFPLNATGKVMKMTLRDAVVEALGQSNV